MRGMTAKRRGGAPQKAPGGLGKVIYVRAWGELVDALDKRTRADRKKTGFSLSRSDVARNILARDLGVRTPLDAVDAGRKSKPRARAAG